MSFFRQQETCINDQSILIKTLEQLGYTPQINEQKVNVRGHGSERRQAEIILLKEDIKEGGDIGFSKNTNGNFEIVADTFVLRHIKLADFTKSTVQAYGVNKTKDIARKNGWQIVSSKAANGSTTLQFAVA